MNDRMIALLARFDRARFLTFEEMRSHGMTVKAAVRKGYLGTGRVMDQLGLIGIVYWLTNDGAEALFSAFEAFEKSRPKDCPCAT